MDTHADPDYDLGRLIKIAQRINNKIADIEEKASAAKGDAKFDLEKALVFLKGPGRFAKYAKYIESFLRAEVEPVDVKKLEEVAEQEVNKISNNISNKSVKESLNDLYLDIKAIAENKITERDMIKQIYNYLTANKKDYKSEGLLSRIMVGKIDKTMEDIINLLKRGLTSGDPIEVLKEIRLKIGFQMTEMLKTKQHSDLIKSPLYKTFNDLADSIDLVTSGKEEKLIKASVDKNFPSKSERKGEPHHAAAAGMNAEAGAGAGAVERSEDPGKSRPGMG